MNQWPVCVRFLGAPSMALISSPYREVVVVKVLGAGFGELLALCHPGLTQGGDQNVDRM